MNIGSLWVVMKKFIKHLLLASFFIFGFNLQAKHTPPPQFTNSAQDFYGNILKSYQKGDHQDVIFNAKCLLSYYPNSPFASEASFYQGVSYFVVHDYDFANQALSRYLKAEATPKFFDEAMEYKYKIALKFQKGHKKHLMGFGRLPKWMPAREEALQIYDEIITSLPRHDLTGKSLFQKGLLLSSFHDYKSSIDSFKTLIRRFPKHERAPDAFLAIADVYLKQCREEFPDTDILDLMKVNLEKFQESFPSEPRLVDAEKKLLEMKTFFAKDLFDIGDFYERTKKFSAAEIYFDSVITKYPETKYAKKAHKRLPSLKKKIKKKAK